MSEGWLLYLEIVCPGSQPSVKMSKPMEARHTHSYGHSYHKLSALCDFVISFPPRLTELSKDCVLYWSIFTRNMSSNRGSWWQLYWNLAPQDLFQREAERQSAQSAAKPESLGEKFGSCWMVLKCIKYHILSYRRIISYHIVSYHIISDW